MWLNIKKKKCKKLPVLHIVYTHTHFQDSIFLKGESARDLSDRFIKASSSVYVGYPKILIKDHGSVFTSEDWRSWTSMSGISLKISGMESNNFNGVVERYHDP